MNAEFFNLMDSSLMLRYFIKSGEIRKPKTEEEGIFTRYVTADETYFQTFKEWANYITKSKVENVYFVTLGKGNIIDKFAFMQDVSFSFLILFVRPDGISFWRQSFIDADDNLSISWNEFIIDSDQRPIPNQLQNNSELFLQTLREITIFAKKIDAANFATIFEKAQKQLTASSFGENIERFDFLPLTNKRLIATVMQAWVFGGIGSWLNEPTVLASNANLAKTYEELTCALYENIAEAALYAINHW